MTELDIAKERLLSSSLALVAGRLSRESHLPGPHDDAQSELDDEIFDDAAKNYTRLLAERGR